MKQIDALEIMKSRKNVYLCGKPGSGKTYTVNLFQAWAAENRIYPDVTASTGIAATHINGVTIHSWAGIGIKEVIDMSDVREIEKKSYVVKRIIDCQVLIIDEISMLSAQTLDNVDYVCRQVRAIVAPAYASMPFGGIQVIFVGDFFQLPPVSKGKTQNKFAFESDAWLAANPEICYLTEQHRQEDDEFLEILTAMRDSKLKPKHLATLRSHIKKAPKDIMRLFTHNSDVDHLNNAELAKLPGPKETYTMTEFGVPFLVETLKRGCLSPAVLELKVGAPVMFTRNDTNNPQTGYKAQWVNGTQGIVVEFDADGYPIIETNEGKTIHINEFTAWEIEERKIVKARITQLPLRLAWAITVHKCQGMSLDAATMDLSNAFEFGQGYVALSRVRSLKGLYLEGLNQKALMMHPTVIEKDKLFRKLSK